jgi:hypothetical protein
MVIMIKQPRIRSANYRPTTPDELADSFYRNLEFGTGGLSRHNAGALEPIVLISIQLEWPLRDLPIISKKHTEQLKLESSYCAR